MNLIQGKKCSKCGGKIIRKGIDLGYSSAQELGRPAGAKGRDEFAIVECCKNCEGTEWVYTVVPCHICGGTPVECVSMLDRNKDVTGLYEWVPGLPNEVNICPNCGGGHLNEKIQRLMDEAFQTEGAFD